MGRSAARKRAKRAASPIKPEKQPLSLKLIFTALKASAYRLNDDRYFGLAKEAAYSGILSFFPLIVSFIALFFIWGETDETVGEVLITLHRMLPVASYLVVEKFVKGLALNPNTKVFWISLGGAIWTGSGVTLSLQYAFCVIYEVPLTRGFWKRRLIAVILVLAAGTPLFFATITALFGNFLEQWLATKYGFDFVWSYLWSLGRWIIVWLSALMISILLYRVGVDRKQTTLKVLPGSILASSLWLIITLLFNFYVQHFGDYDKVYGSLGAVIVLLSWMFFTALVLLYGAAFNLQLERSLNGEVTPPS